MKPFVISLSLLLAALAADAQPTQRRRASPQAMTSTQVGGVYDDSGRYVGGAWIDILHGRPIKRGRSIFGPPDFFRTLNDGAPVWRAGADITTRLRTEIALRFGDTVVEPGEYTMFVDVTTPQWIFILTTWEAQLVYEGRDREKLWGAYHYHPGKDVVRRPMTVEKLEHSFEQLSWQFLDLHDFGGKMAVLWDDHLAWVAFGIENP